MKYLVMICRGHVPVWDKKINSDTVEFLKYFLPKGTKFDRLSAKTVVCRLHLAFKNMETGEVYDVLMQKCLEAVVKYDPDYIIKIKRVVECIDHELKTYKQIRACDIGRHVDFDSDRHLRLLARRGFLQTVKGKDGKVSGWVRSECWPPPASFTDNKKPIGLAYYLQTWFRYYLQQWIEERLREIESKEGIYSFGDRETARGKGPGSGGYHLRGGNIDGTFIRANDEELVQSEHVFPARIPHR